MEGCVHFLFRSKYEVSLLAILIMARYIKIHSIPLRLGFCRELVISSTWETIFFIWSDWTPIYSSS